MSIKKEAATVKRQPLDHKNSVVKNSKLQLQRELKPGFKILI
jgi:hypothetical protein